MTDRMSSFTSDTAEAPDIPDTDPFPDPEVVSVVVAVTVVAGVDPAATLAAVERQRLTPSAIRVVGADVADAPRGVVLNEDIEAVVAELDSSVDYVWILHGDAEPRPDALGALVAEVERFEASLGGSKLLVGGTRDTLEGVGSATDVFGEPYTGLDEGEVDLEQYDVVRDVAFVSSVSMLVRRDILRGLRGLDSLLAPVAAGLDLSQRVRLAGGRVIVVPSSEVFHGQRCGRGDGGWREQSGRMRAMIKAYRPVTLAWLIPFALFAGLLDSLGSLFLGRWRLFPRYLATWLWNLVNLPSTIAARRGLARVREVGDEELFRYQVRGSVRLRLMGSELSDRLLALFDDDRPLARRATEVWNSAGTWGLLAALLLVLVGVRAVFLGGLPAVGFSLPPAEDAVATLGRVFGGWNTAGLGTTAPVHPANGVLALLHLILPGGPEVARSVVSLAAFVGGVVGMGRLATRIRVAGPGSYLGGVVALFGLAAAVLAAGGRWSALVAIGILPWALLGVVGPRLRSRRRFWAVAGAGAVAVTLVSAFVPLLGFVPILFALVLRTVGRFPARPLVALVSTAGVVVGVPHIITRSAHLLGGVPLPVQTELMPTAALVVTLAAGMVAGAWRVALLSSFASLGGIAVARLVGPDLQEPILVISALGTGLAVAAALRPVRLRSAPSWVAVGGAVLLLMLSLDGLSGGRAGLPADRWGDEVAFIGIESMGVERALLLAPQPSDLPGEASPGPGFWYRLIESRGPTMDQALLGPRGTGDVALASTLEAIAAGAVLDPGSALAQFGVRWLVMDEETAAALRPALDAQVDLAPLPLVEDLIVYENTVPAAVVVAADGAPWEADGTGYVGPDNPGRVRLAFQHASDWGPDWQPQTWAGTVDGSSGRAVFDAFLRYRVLMLAAAIVLVAGAGLAIWGREQE